MDIKRKEHIAYEYLCHLEEAKKWVQSSMQVESGYQGVAKIKYVLQSKPVVGTKLCFYLFKHPGMCPFNHKTVTCLWIVFRVQVSSL